MYLLLFFVLKHRTETFMMQQEDNPFLHFDVELRNLFN